MKLVLQCSIITCIDSKSNETSVSVSNIENCYYNYYDNNLIINLKFDFKLHDLPLRVIQYKTDANVCLILIWHLKYWWKYSCKGNYVKTKEILA